MKRYSNKIIASPQSFCHLARQQRGEDGSFPFIFLYLLLWLFWNSLKKQQTLSFHGYFPSLADRFAISTLGGGSFPRQQPTFSGLYFHSDCAQCIEWEEGTRCEICCSPKVKKKEKKKNPLIDENVYWYGHHAKHIYFWFEFRASAVKTNLPNAQKDSEAQLLTFPRDRKLH